ncbi:MAG: GxxExxY protein [Planctomycetia bacterium]|nr:GxxExxY protein [Planctomycetia bacterium]
MDINEISGRIVNAAMTVHSAPGPGLLESAYEGCLVHELKRRDIQVASQVILPVVYDGIKIDVGYRIDLMVANAVIVEIKAVDKLAPIHEAQLLTYLKLSGMKLGLLLNFNVVHMKDGIKRMVNKL